MLDPQALSLLRPLVSLLLFILLINLLYASFYRHRIKAEAFVLVNSFLLLLGIGVILYLEGLFVLNQAETPRTSIDLGIGSLVVFLLIVGFIVFQKNKKD